MSEVQDFLPESEARELLNSFLGEVCVNTEVNTYNDFLGIISRTQLPLAIGSMIERHGAPNPRVPGQVGIETRVQGWKFSAHNDRRDRYSGTLVSRTRRGLVGGRERNLVRFHHYNIRGAKVIEDTLGSCNTYYIDDANPQLKDAWRPLGEVSTYKYPDDGGTLPFVIILAKSRGPAPETITKFLDISSRLVGQLLKATKDLS